MYFSFCFSSFSFYRLSERVFQNLLLLYYSLSPVLSISYRILSKLSPQQLEHVVLGHYLPPLDHPLTFPADIEFLSIHSSSTTFLIYLLYFSFSLPFLILFSLKTQCKYYPTWKTFWNSAHLAFLSLPVVCVFLPSYN